MAAKLGEMLVQEGLITSGQLEDALRYQVIFGGRLGTNLLEMGLLGEEDLARFLGRKYGVPFLERPDRLQTIPGEVLKLVPPEFAGKHKVIPLSLENRRLTLVMADPSDFRVAEEIAFRTGFAVRPVVTPEIRLVLALEKHYQTPRDLRYVQILGHVSTSPSPPKQAPPPAPKEDPGGAPLLVSEEPVELTEIVEPEEIEIPDRLDSVSARLIEARDREDIAGVLGDFLAREFSRGAVFLLRGGTAVGWRAAAHGKAIHGFERLQIPLEEPSILKTVAESRSFFLGPVPRTPFNSMILQELGGGIPQTAILVPLIMMGRTIGILYGEGSSSEAGDKILDLQKLSAKTAMAFDILLLKNKILSL